MTPPRSIMQTLAGLGLFATFSRRAMIMGGLCAALVLLAFFPERYRAVATLTPTDPASLGLGGTLGQLGASNTVFGNQAAIEIAMRVGTSQDIRTMVIRRTHLDQRPDMSPLATHRWMTKRVDVRSLRGGIIQIDLTSRDRVLAQDVVQAYTLAIRDRLSEISRQQTDYKRDILEKLVRDATNGLAAAQRRYDTYRLTNRDAIPEVQTANVANRIAALEGAIRAKKITLAIARQIYTDQHVNVQQLKAEMTALQRDLADAKATHGSGSQSVGSVVASTQILFGLQRELSLQRVLYDSYMRFLAGTSVEDLTSSANMRILEAPHIDTERQYWLPAIAAAVAVLLVWAGMEFYRLRPPLGARLGRADEAGDHV